jgi:4-amino-4-deoxy-L-arabinose transferase-like glycosyltransferase
MNSVIFKRKSFLLIILILGFAAFLRLYQINQYMQFLGDQGRDALVVKDILVNHHLVAIGPPSSVGTVYLGPLYYYMMALPMLVFWLSPVAAAVMVALIGTLSVWLIFYITKKWFGFKGGIVSALLFAISPVEINYSNFSWNPNPVPFFVLLLFLALFKAHYQKNFYWYILAAFSFGALTQLHYLTLILVPVIGLLWLNELRVYRQRKIKHFWSGTLIGKFLFILMTLPLILFDFKNHFINFHGLIDLFSGKGGVSLTLAGSFSRLPEIFLNDFIGRLMGGDNFTLTLVLALLIFIPLIKVWMSFFKTKKISWVFLALSYWLIIGFLGLMIYKGPIYDHYLLFLSPIPFILFGGVVELVLNLKWHHNLVLIFGGIFLVITVLANLSLNPLLFMPSHQLEKTQEIDHFIIQKSENKPFNFALLSKNNYDAAYQFYLDQFGHKPRVVPDQKTNQLFVVCEDTVCQPIGHPKYEIAAFGWAKEEWEQDLDGVKIFKIVPNSQQQNR